MQAMEERKITKLVLKDKNGFELELERDSGFLPPPPVSHHHVAPPPPPAQMASAPQEAAPEAPQEEGEDISSPMVGTFYIKPSPESPPFVKVGDQVDEDTVVCIIEAMKVMNEVKAGKKGMIKKILLDDASPVEFGTKLFIIES